MSFKGRWPPEGKITISEFSCELKARNYKGPEVLLNLTTYIRKSMKWRQLGKNLECTVFNFEVLNAHTGERQQPQPAYLGRLSVRLLIDPEGTFNKVLNLEEATDTYVKIRLYSGTPENSALDYGGIDQFRYTWGEMITREYRELWLSLNEWTEGGEMEHIEHATKPCLQITHNSKHDSEDIVRRLDEHHEALFDEDDIPPSELLEVKPDWRHTYSVIVDADSQKPLISTFIRQVKADFTYQGEALYYANVKMTKRLLSWPEIPITSTQEYVREEYDKFFQLCQDDYVNMANSYPCVSRELEIAVQDVFELYDCDKSDAIDLQELGNLLEKLKGERMSPEEIEDIYKTLDVGGSKDIDKNEFLTYVVNESKKKDGVISHLAIMNLVGAKQRGILKKQGGFIGKQWQARFFILDRVDASLTYFEKIPPAYFEDVILPNGRLFLHKYSKCVPSEKDDLIFELIPVDPSKKTYRFMAQNKAERDRWAKMIDKIARSASASMTGEDGEKLRDIMSKTNVTCGEIDYVTYDGI